MFFFNFCGAVTGTLCASATVGAFYSTAGSGVLIDTPAAAQSRYVTEEISAAIHLRAGERPITLVTAEQVGTAIQTRVLVAAVQAN